MTTEARPAAVRRAGDGSVATGNRPVRRSGRATPYLFLAPFLVLFVGFVLLPAVYGIYISLHDYNYLLPGKPFVGLQNYIDLFTPSSRDAGPFWGAMRASAIFTVLSVPFLLVIPLGVALLLNRAFPSSPPTSWASRWSASSSDSSSSRRSAW
jgi:multiple sugar transport system permease protein